MVEQQPADRRLLRAGLRRPHRQRHRQAAADQDDGVDAAEQDVELEAAFGPRLRIPHAIEQVGHEQAAEEHDLGDEEDPHAERGRFVLLLQRLEVVLQRRMMRVHVPVRIGVRGDPVRQL